MCPARTPTRLHFGRVLIATLAVGVIPVVGAPREQRRVQPGLSVTEGGASSPDDVVVVPQGPHETPVAPPQAPLRSEQQRAAAVAPIVRGRFTSVQVNINGNGDDILNDAANEPSIAVDPNDRNKIAIGWRQFDTILNNFRQAGIAYSQDGGTTWTFPGVLDPGQFRSDPVLAADADGNADLDPATRYAYCPIAAERNACSDNDFRTRPRTLVSLYHSNRRIVQNRHFPRFRSNRHRHGPRSLRPRLPIQRDILDRKSVV